MHSTGNINHIRNSPCGDRTLHVLIQRQFSGDRPSILYMRGEGRISLVPIFLVFRFDGQRLAPPLPYEQFEPDISKL